MRQAAMNHGGPAGNSEMGAEGEASAVAQALNGPGPASIIG